MTTLDGTWNYGYDLTGQLTRAIFTSNYPTTLPNQDLTYAYDAAGNRIQTIENGKTTDYLTG
jgi:YD repeat-containing protein